MVIRVPPAVDPELGENEVMVGVDIRYVNKEPATAYPPFSFTTATPYASGHSVRGVLQVMVVAVILTASHSSPSPRLTRARGRNPVPVMLSNVPPAVGPELGENEVMVGPKHLVIPTAH